MAQKKFEVPTKMAETMMKTTGASDAFIMLRKKGGKTSIISIGMKWAKDEKARMDLMDALKDAFERIHLQFHLDELVQKIDASGKKKPVAKKKTVTKKKKTR